MSARDEFARDVFIADNANLDTPQAAQDWDENREHHDYAFAIADGLITAGYRKPDVVELTPDHIADLVRLLRSSSEIAGRVSLPREAVNLLLDRLQPKQVTTAEELDALPEDSAIHAQWIEVMAPSVMVKDGKSWFCPSDGDFYDSVELVLPATVLHEAQA